jgi:hypothetical protein
MRSISLFILVVLICAVSVFGWHVAFTVGLKREFEKKSAQSKDQNLEATMSVNVLTNLVTITVTQEAPNSDSLWDVLGFKVSGELLKAVAPGMLEKEINASAREYYDVLGLLVPYKVQMVRITKRPKSKLSLP